MRRIRPVASNVCAPPPLSALVCECLTSCSDTPIPVVSLSPQPHRRREAAEANAEVSAHLQPSYHR
eukprot:2378142-Pleurochrysis_carterae.AAC.1